MKDNIFDQGARGVFPQEKEAKPPDWWDYDSHGPW